MKIDRVYDEASGLDIDYDNAWVHLDWVHFGFKEGFKTRREFLEALREPIQKYEDYMRQKNSHRSEDPMKYAKPEALEELNQLVDEYNSLCLIRKRHETTFLEYRKRVIEIIEGQPEQ
jgi:hypothetical protein